MAVGDDRGSMVRYELSLRDYLRIVHRRRLLIILSVVACFLLALYYVVSQPVVYQSSSRVKMEQFKTIAGLLTEALMYAPGDIMQSQAKIITGMPVLRRAVVLAGLAPEGDEAAVMREVARIRGHVKAEPEGDTNVIRITVSGPDPSMVVSLANAVAEAYMEYDKGEKNKKARASREFIERQLAQIRKDMAEYERRLAAFSEDVRSDYTLVELEKKLAALKLKREELLQHYTRKHPAVVDVDEQIGLLSEKVEKFARKRREYEKLKREMAILRDNYVMLRKQLAQAKIREAEKVSDVTILDRAMGARRVGRLVSSLVLFMGVVLGCLVGFFLALVVEYLDTSIGTIDDVEKVARLHVLGVVPTIEVGGEDEGGVLKRLLKMLVPSFRVGRDERGRRLVSHFHPRSQIAEMFRHIRTSLRVSEERKMIMVTSAGPREGKTTVLSNLGIVCAQAGMRTLLVDADMRKPALAETFGLPRKPGLSDFLLGSVALEEIIRDSSDLMLGELGFDGVLKGTGMDRLFIVAAGSFPDNPVELLGSSEMRSFLEKMRMRYDLVLVDTPPVLPVADASVLAGMVDGVLFCYEMGRTSREALVRAKERMESVNAVVIGVVLNHTRPETQMRGVYTYPVYAPYGHNVSSVARD